MRNAKVTSKRGKEKAPRLSFFKSKDIEKADFDKAIGKTMSIEVSRARDGSHSGLLRNITMP